MSVPNTNYQNLYTGDGSTTTFGFTFRIIHASDVVVTVGGVAQSGFTVNMNPTDGIGGALAGTVTLLSAPTSGAAVVVSQSPSYLQSDVLVEGEPVDGPTIETALDQLTVMVQHCARALGFI